MEDDRVPATNTEDPGTGGVRSTEPCQEDADDQYIVLDEDDAGISKSTSLEGTPVLNFETTEGITNFLLEEEQYVILDEDIHTDGPMEVSASHVEDIHVPEVEESSVKPLSQDVWEVQQHVGLDEAVTTIGEFFNRSVTSKVSIGGAKDLTNVEESSSEPHLMDNGSDQQPTILKEGTTFRSKSIEPSNAPELNTYVDMDLLTVEKVLRKSQRHLHQIGVQDAILEKGTTDRSGPTGSKNIASRTRGMVVEGASQNPLLLVEEKEQTHSMGIGGHCDEGKQATLGHNSEVNPRPIGVEKVVNKMLEEKFEGFQAQMQQILAVVRNVAEVPEGHPSFGDGDLIESRQGNLSHQHQRADPNPDKLTDQHSFEKRQFQEFLGTISSILDLPATQNSVLDDLMMESAEATPPVGCLPVEGMVQNCWQNVSGTRLSRGPLVKEITSQYPWSADCWDKYGKTAFVNSFVGDCVAQSKRNHTIGTLRKPSVMDSELRNLDTIFHGQQKTFSYLSYYLAALGKHEKEEKPVDGDTLSKMLKYIGKGLVDACNLSVQGCVEVTRTRQGMFLDALCVKNPDVRRNIVEQPLGKELFHAGIEDVLRESIPGSAVPGAASAKWPSKKSGRHVNPQKNQQSIQDQVHQRQGDHKQSDDLKAPTGAAKTTVNVSQRAETPATDRPVDAGKSDFTQSERSSRASGDSENLTKLTSTTRTPVDMDQETKKLRQKEVPTSTNGKGSKTTTRNTANPTKHTREIQDSGIRTKSSKRTSHVESKEDTKHKEGTLHSGMEGGPIERTTGVDSSDVRARKNETRDSGRKGGSSKRTSHVKSKVDTKHKKETLISGRGRGPSKRTTGDKSRDVRPRKKETQGSGEKGGSSKRTSHVKSKEDTKHKEETLNSGRKWGPSKRTTSAKSRDVRPRKKETQDSGEKGRSSKRTSHVKSKEDTEHKEETLNSGRKCGSSSKITSVESGDVRQCERETQDSGEKGGLSKRTTCVESRNATTRMVTGMRSGATKRIASEHPRRFSKRRRGNREWSTRAETNRRGYLHSPESFTPAPIRSTSLERLIEESQMSALTEGPIRSGIQERAMEQNKMSASEHLAALFDSPPIRGHYSLVDPATTCAVYGIPETGRI